MVHDLSAIGKMPEMIVVAINAIESFEKSLSLKEVSETIKKLEKLQARKYNSR